MAMAQRSPPNIAPENPQVKISCPVRYRPGMPRVYTVEPQIKDTIEITSEQRTRFNVPNGDFPIDILNLR